VDLRRQIAIIRNWLPLLVASVVLAAAVGYLVSGLLPKMYEAKSTLIVGAALSSVSPDYSQLLVSQNLSTTYANVATRRPVLESVIKQLGLNVSAGELATRVHADAPVSSTFLTISAQDADPSVAAKIANAVAEQLIADSPGIQGRQVEFQASIDADLKATQDQIVSVQTRVETLTAVTGRTAVQDAELSTLEGRLVTLRSTYATLLSYSSNNVSNLLSVVEPAVAPDAPVSPRPLLNTLLAAALGLLIAVGVVAIAEYLDDSIKSPDQVLDVTGLTTLGMIARMKGDRARNEIYRLAVLLYPRSGIAEAYRTLRANIEFASVDATIGTLLVTSAVPGEGKTVTAANLAVAFAQAGRRVLLVDADLRKPGAHLVYGLPNAQGLTTMLLSDDASLDAIAQATELANLRVLTTGPLPPNPAELLGSQRMRTILERLKSGGDLIIFDGPPLGAVTDSALLSSFLDGTIMVIDARRGHRRAVRLGREALTRAGANVLGAVLNRVPARAYSGAEYYGYYGSEDGTDSRPGELDRSPKRSAS
jgi:non-specific protein-tyrosine kinase